jgi:hypothetical protein
VKSGSPLTWADAGPANASTAAADAAAMRVLMSGSTPVLGCADKIRKIKTNSSRFKGK